MEKAISTTEQRIIDIFESLTSEFICPITQMPMKNPVITEDGHSYQQGAIYKWLLTSKKSPKTGLILEYTKLTPNLCLKQLIEKLDFLKNQILHQIFEIISPMLRQVGIGNLNHQFPLLAEQIKLKKDSDSKLYGGQYKNKSKPDKSKTIGRQKDEIFEEWLKILNFHSQHHNQLPENVLLEPYEYLLQKFNYEEEQIADRYRKDRYTHELGLWHNNIPTESMSVFVKYDWNVLQFINLCKCQINDQAWNLLSKHSNTVFSQLKTIWIYGNQITIVTQNHLQAFRKLKQIQFSHYNGLTNPFTLKTKQNLKKFKSKPQHQHIYIQYTN